MTQLALRKRHRARIVAIGVERRCIVEGLQERPVFAGQTATGIATKTAPDLRSD